MSGTHFFRPDICMNGRPVAKQAREHNPSFAQEMTFAEFSQRGNALSASVLRWPRGSVFSRGKFFEAFNHEARSLGFYQTERAAAKAVRKATPSRQSAARGAK
jgi:hypothetical protein